MEPRTVTVFMTIIFLYVIGATSSLVAELADSPGGLHLNWKNQTCNYLHVVRSEDEGWKQKIFVGCQDQLHVLKEDLTNDGNYKLSSLGQPSCFSDINGFTDSPCDGSNMQVTNIQYMDYRVEREEKGLLLVCVHAEKSECGMYNLRRRANVPMSFPEIDFPNATSVKGTAFWYDYKYDDTKIYVTEFMLSFYSPPTEKSKSKPTIVRKSFESLSGLDINAPITRTLASDMYPWLSEYDVVHMFSDYDGLYAYWIANRPTGRNGQVVSTIVRTCTDKDFEVGYIESPISCTVDGEEYAIATTASVYSLDDKQEVLNTRGVNQNATRNVLTMSFSDGGGSKGTAICRLTLQDLDDRLTQMLWMCETGKSDMRAEAPWFGVGGDDVSCHALENRTGKSDIACDPTNQGVYAVTTMKLKAVAHSNADAAAVMVSTVPDSADTTVVVMVDTEGRVHKFLPPGPGKVSRKPYHVRSVLQDSPVIPGTSYDVMERQLYVGSPTELVRTDVHSCVYYETCVECRTSKDPLGCGWCNGTCVRQSRCPAKMIDETCAVNITSFQPINGPIQGQTNVTVRGENLVGQITVTVAGTPCHVDVATTRVDRLTCTTGVSLAGEAEGPVIVRVSSPLSSTNDTSLGLFSYKEVQVHDFSPKVGFLAGGTRVVVTGSNFDVGGPLEVLIGSNKCHVNRFNATYLDCDYEGALNPHLNETDRDKPRNSSFVLVKDGATLNGSEKFRLFPAPVLSRQPQLKAFVGGGLPLVFGGTRLHLPSTQTFVVPDAGASSTCSVVEKTSSLLCPAPALKERIRDNGIMKKSYLDLDGYRISEIYVKYYPDPFIASTTDLKETKEGLRIFLLGERLNQTATKASYDVTLEAESGAAYPCVVTSLSWSSLMCDVTDASATAEEKLALTVKVGYLTFFPESVYPTPVQGEALKRAEFLAPLIVGVVLLIAVIVVIACVLYRKRQQKKREEPNLPDVHYSAGGTVPRGDGYTRYIQGGAEGQPLLDGATPQSIHYEALINPATLTILKDRLILINPERLALAEIIGEGNFGSVRRGYLSTPGEKEDIIVAIKTLHSVKLEGEGVSKEIDAFMSEALTMSEFDHSRVLSLIGFCLPDNKLPMAVIPYMEHGDLLTYIRNENNHPSVLDLIEFAVQVAEGMEYLASKKFVHRDLAARNCMLDMNYQVRVADFGLSRDVYTTTYYVPHDPSAKIPVKWMALESLERKVWSERSDVWSFGVLMWELLTRGVTPYPCVNVWEVVSYLRQGRRLPRPEYCPDNIYQMMLATWQQDPHDRPTFTDLISLIRGAVNSVLHTANVTTHAATNELYVNVPVDTGYLEPVASPR